MHYVFNDFVRRCKDKYPTAAELLTKDREKLLPLYELPAPYWQSIGTTNSIESIFATIGYRTKCSKECLNHQGLLSTLFKLGQSTEHQWRRLNGFRKLGQVIKGVKFKDGIEVTELDNRVAA